MAISLFKSFLSTISPFHPSMTLANLRLLVDPTTGAPTGIQSPNANGPDGIWTPIDITAAQIANPTPAMLADLNATYRLNVAPYTQYVSSGIGLVGLTSLFGVQVGNGLLGIMIAYSPLTVSDPAGLSIQGTVSVRALPA